MLMTDPYADTASSPGRARCHRRLFKILAGLAWRAQGPEVSTATRAAHDMSCPMSEAAGPCMPNTGAMLTGQREVTCRVQCLSSPSGQSNLWLIHHRRMLCGCSRRGQSTRTGTRSWGPTGPPSHLRAPSSQRKPSPATASTCSRTAPWCSAETQTISPGVSHARISAFNFTIISRRSLPVFNPAWRARMHQCVLAYGKHYCHGRAACSLSMTRDVCPQSEGFRHGCRQRSCGCSRTTQQMCCAEGSLTS